MKMLLTSLMCLCCAVSVLGQKKEEDRLKESADVLKEIMGAEATTKINRKDFGVNGAAGVVGDDIQITLDVELTRPAK